LLNGLDKIRSTEDKVAVLKDDLTELQPELERKEKEIAIMMEKLTIDAKEAEEQAKAARIDEAAAMEKQQECAQIQAQCHEQLAEAEPALEEAVKSLSKLKPSDISEVGSYKMPPAGVALCMEAVCKLLAQASGLQLQITPVTVADPDRIGKKKVDWWQTAKKVLGDAKLLKESMIEFPKERMTREDIEVVQPYISMEEFSPAKVEKSSAAAKTMCVWVHSMYKWYFVNERVKPLRDELAIATSELALVTAQCEKAQGAAAAAKAAVDSLNFQCEKARNEQKALVDRKARTEKQLERAGKLTTLLGDEKLRWGQDAERLGGMLDQVLGNMLIASASVAYFGPLTAQYRRELQETWAAMEEEAGIKRSSKYDLISTCGDPILIQSWNVQGLPSDNLSTENAIILSKASSWPLMIDPQGQANRWIRNKHKGDLVVCKVTDDAYEKQIAMAIRQGLPCLLEGIGEDLDPLLDPVLLKQVYKEGGRFMVRLGPNAVEYEPSFRLYMTTKYPNPSYTPENTVKVSLLNFFITPKGLEDQLLGKLVEKENAEAETRMKQLLKQSAESRATLKELQDRVLRLLQESKGEILDDEDLINALQDSKVKSTEIQKELVIAADTTVTIEKIREEYRPLSHRASLLFFCVTAMDKVDPMYQFALQWFMMLFSNVIDKTAKVEGETVDERLQTLTDALMYAFYQNVCRSLFERHKLHFSFHLCVSVITEQGHCDFNEHRFLLAGPTAAISNPPPNPAPDWLGPVSWDEFLFMDHYLPNLKGIAQCITENVAHFKNIYDSAQAHREPLPGKFSEITPLQRLCITRALRLDKLSLAVQDFVTHFIGEKFIITPTFNLAEAYEDSDCCVPLIFILSAGADPMVDLLKFAETKKMNRNGKLEKVSLGQGQEKKATNLINDGVSRGTWVLLQNCHLATSWMPALEVLVENFNPEQTKKEFRLWLTSMPSKVFPVSVLQISVKMTNEPPKGLRSNMTRSYAGFKEDDLEHASKPGEFKKLLFATCLFHACIQERRKFGALGWNIQYEFNDSDRDCCIKQLNKFLSIYDEVPYDVLTFLTGDINYGGRVTDDWDRRCLNTMLEDFINPNVLEVGYKYSKSGTYFTPEPGNKQYYQDLFSSWPINAFPEAFALHDNADITCARNESNDMLVTILALQEGAGGGGGASRDSELLRMAGEIQAKIPAPFSLFAFQEKYPTSYNESMNTVIVQEAMRYNRLLNIMATALREFMRAVRGEVVMSRDLEGVGQAMYVNNVPASWAAAAYPSLMPLTAWVDDLVQRTRFVQKWYDLGHPRVYWISGIFFPQAFLTGTLQNYARTSKIAIDRVRWGYEWQKVDHTQIAAKPKVGAYIYGLNMEGARFDKEKGKLCESRPKELFTDLPPLYLIPVEDRVAPTNVYVCPVYKTLTRAGTLSTTGHSTNFVLQVEIPTAESPAHWIKRGVAIVTSLQYSKTVVIPDP